jgi:drug/metabolite transporter (DMT)-like permease
MTVGAPAVARPPRWMTLGAFAIIYFVWGSTFLAIRVGVHEVPPFLLASLRFLVAGLVLFGWSVARRESFPTPRQWMAVFVVALLIFVFDYGLLFRAEQRVPSGIVAVMMATIPAFTAVAEVILLRTQQMTARLAAALLIGIAGVGVLVSRALNLGGAPIDTAGAIALVFASMSWSLASVLNRKLPLPASRPLNSGAQMLAGGVLLAIASLTLGEPRQFHPEAVSLKAWLSLLYLIVLGSIVGFTAWLWLIHHESPTKVGTYAYVNPVVAVLIGYFLGHEEIGLRTAVGTLLVLASVILITTQRKAA